MDQPLSQSEKMDFTLPRYPGITLRPVRSADAADLAHHGNDIEIWRNMPASFPFPYTVSEAQRWISTLDANAAEWSICDNDRAIGSIGVELTNMTGTGQIGYWLGRAYRGRGITTAAVKLLTPHIFARYQLHRLEACVFSWNPFSMQILETCGYIREAVLKERILKDGKRLDEHIFVRFNGA